MAPKRNREISNLNRSTSTPSLDDLLSEVNSSFEPVFRPTFNKSPPIQRKSSNPLPTFQQVSLPIQRKSPWAVDPVSINSGLRCSRRSVSVAGQVSPTGGLGHFGKSLNEYFKEIPGTPSKDIPGTPSTQSAWSEDEDVSCFASFPGSPHGEGVCAAPMKDADLKFFKAPRTPCSSGVAQTNPCSFKRLQDWVEGHKNNSDDASWDSASDHPVSDTKSAASGDESTTPKATQGSKAPATTKSATLSSVLNLVQGVWETSMKSRVLINGRKATWTSGADHKKLGCTATMSEVNCSTLEMCFDTSKGDSWQATVKMSDDGSLNLVWSDGDQWRKMNTPAIVGQGDKEERAKATPPEQKGTPCREVCVFSDSNVNEPSSTKRTKQKVHARGTRSSELQLSSSATTERDVAAGLASLSTASLRTNSQISQLQGLWTYNRTTKGPVKVKIEGDTVTWPLGEKAKIAGEEEAEEGNDFMLQFEGQHNQYYAKVRPEDGALCWNDGAIWTRVVVNVTPPLQERPEQPSRASLPDHRDHDSFAGSLRQLQNRPPKMEYGIAKLHS